MASDTKFTPGPWLLDMNNVHTGTIALVHQCTDGWADIWSDKWVEHGMSEDVMDANARLIAAAPELYEALVCLLARAENELADPEDVHEVVLAKATISKARGQE